MKRVFTCQYDSINGACHFKPGDVAEIIQMFGLDADVRINGIDYTLPKEDFIGATKELP